MHRCRYKVIQVVAILKQCPVSCTLLPIRRRSIDYDTRELIESSVHHVPHAVTPMPFPKGSYVSSLACDTLSSHIKTTSNHRRNSTTFPTQQKGIA